MQAKRPNLNPERGDKNEPASLMAPTQGQVGHVNRVARLVDKEVENRGIYPTPDNVIASSLATRLRRENGRVYYRGRLLQRRDAEVRPPFGCRRLEWPQLDPTADDQAHTQEVEVAATSASQSTESESLPWVARREIQSTRAMTIKSDNRRGDPTDRNVDTEVRGQRSRRFTPRRACPLGQLTELPRSRDACIRRVGGDVTCEHVPETVREGRLPDGLDGSSDSSNSSTSENERSRRNNSVGSRHLYLVSSVGAALGPRKPPSLSLQQPDKLTEFDADVEAGQTRRRSEPNTASHCTSTRINSSISQLLFPSASDLCLTSLATRSSEPHQPRRFERLRVGIDVKKPFLDEVCFVWHKNTARLQRKMQKSEM
ncbi:unnamed protein product [Protopolystoma xenopodis]|uniref:Uncharacterized protein n=1 Tax=Protopolystoma xenopodis TaxID=117903 RepID=A0A3S4ZV08_9PLAT|nr:unnamed protein product [Protopolystoma xenopodis]